MYTNILFTIIDKSNFIFWLTNLKNDLSGRHRIGLSTIKVNYYCVKRLNKIQLITLGSIEMVWVIIVDNTYTYDYFVK